MIDKGQFYTKITFGHFSERKLRSTQFVFMQRFTSVLSRRFFRRPIGLFSTKNIGSIDTPSTVNPPIGQKKSEGNTDNPKGVNQSDENIGGAHVGVIDRDTKSAKNKDGKTTEKNIGGSTKQGVGSAENLGQTPDERGDGSQRETGKIWEPTSQTQGSQINNAGSEAFQRPGQVGQNISGTKGTMSRS